MTVAYLREQGGRGVEGEGESVAKLMRDEWPDSVRERRGIGPVVCLMIGLAGMLGTLANLDAQFAGDPNGWLPASAAVTMTVATALMGFGMWGLWRGGRSTASANKSV